MKRRDVPFYRARSFSIVKRVVATFALFIAGALLFSVTAFFVIPVHLVESWIVEGVRERGGIHLSGETFQRALPFGFVFTNLSLRQREGREELFTFDRLEGRIHPMALIRGKVRITVTGITEEGDIAGEVLLRRRGMVINLNGRNIDVHYLSGQAVQGNGNIGYFTIHLSLTPSRDGCPTGIITARSSDIATQGITVMGFAPPLESIDEAGLKAVVKDCSAEIESLWLESRNFSSRLKGEILLNVPLKTSRIDMTLEVIPKGELLKNRLLLALLEGYRKSANYYSIPIRGTLGTPLIVRQP
ncbi:MAG: type II secretion system protein GspN [Thermodesulfobacteriota bacterium]